MSVILPLFAVFVFGYGLIRRVPVFSAFCEGVKSGLKTCADIFPVLLFMIVSVRVFRASGAMDILISALAPICHAAGLPEQLLPLALIRPLSGGGALSICRETLLTYGADSYFGRCAAVLSASTETTFYTVGIYLGGKSGKGTGKFLFCAVCCDVITFYLCVIVCRFL